MKKRTKIVLIVITVFIVFVIGVVLAFKFGCMVGYNLMKREVLQSQVEEIETFFDEKGYSIDIIGANTNGREHGVPFADAWSWKSFEIGTEVVVLYHYDDKSEINGYMESLDDKRRSNCTISEDFVFYYDGEDETITNAIKEFCK